MNIKDSIEKCSVGQIEDIVLICTRCGNQFENKNDKDAPERLRKELKSLVKAECGKRIRVLSTSCLSLCPKNKVAIAITHNTSEKCFEGYAVDITISAEEVFNSLLKNPAKNE